MFWNMNSRNRTDLNAMFRETIKFKVLFPDYETWKTKLKDFGATEDQIPEADYKMLISMIGNSYLAYKTDEKNCGFIVFTLKDLWARRRREEVLYNTNQDALLRTISAIEIKNFGVDNTDTEISDDFLSNATRQGVENTIAPIDRIKELMELNNLQAPEITFLIRLANEIVLPMQPKQRQEVF